jgi:ABC-type phosphate transport system substrate-binding protein
VAESPPDLLVIVHPENPLSSVSREFLTDAFLKRVTRFDDGETIKPVDLQPSSGTRRVFSERVLRRSVAAVRSYWQQRIFSGRALPPPELDTEEAAVNYVLKYRGGVGYVWVGTHLEGAKVLVVK